MQIDLNYGFGLMQTTSLGNRYFVTFIEEKYRFTAIYFMESKGQVLQVLKEYLAMATNVIGKKIKVMTASDSTAKSMKNFCSDNGGKLPRYRPRPKWSLVVFESFYHPATESEIKLRVRQFARWFW